MPREELLAILREMIVLLAQEQEQTVAEFSDHPAELLTIWRSLVNTRPVVPPTARYLELEATFLTWFNGRAVKTLADCDQVADKLYLYEGDVTELAVAAIVNPANSQLLGCFKANHHCLDNAIHTFAGVQLRLACAAIMAQQGRKEPVGQAKLTSAYHLPADVVIHTVGPYIPPGQSVSPLRADLLRQCYRACLDLADQHQLISLAFSCIATGEFGFPKEQAAVIAVQTVQEWQTNTASDLNIIFALFTEEDRKLYRRLLDERRGHDLDRIS